MNKTRGVIYHPGHPFFNAGFFLGAVFMAGFVTCFVASFVVALWEAFAVAKV